MIISKQTALDIWCAYDEIAKGEKLLQDMLEAIQKGDDPNPRDAFGRQRNLQMGVPSGENCHRLLDVNPKLAIAVIRAHIADKQAALLLANEIARTELSKGATP